MIDKDAATHTASSSWEEVPSLENRTFVGDWFTVAPDRLPMFDEASYVLENVHKLDGGNFPDGLVEGFHMVSLLDHLTNSVLFVEDPRWSGWNYGLDRVRFASPVTVKDRIRVHGRADAVEPRGENFLVVTSCEIEVEGREKPGMIAIWRVLWTLETGDDA